MTYDVVIVGAGIIGCSSARELASDHDVLVIDRGQVAGDTTGKASGLVTFSAQRALVPDVPKYCLSFFEQYDGTENFKFTQRHTVEMVPPGKQEQARERARLASEYGFPISFHGSDGIQERYPDVFDMSEYSGALEYRDTGWVDPYTTATTFKMDAEERGTEFLTNTPVERIRVENGAAVGVDTPDASFRADTVVCCAGWRTRQLLQSFVELPVRPYRYQALSLDPDRRLTDTYPMGLDPVTGFYWRPEHNGDLHVGGGEYLVRNEGSVRNGVTEEFKLKVATELPKRLNGFNHADFVSDDTCPTGDAATPDSLPIIDQPADGPDNLIVATGFHGYGIMLSPAAGKGVRSLVTADEAPFALDPFSVDRFESRSPDFELVSLAEKRAKHH